MTEQQNLFNVPPAPKREPERDAPDSDTPKESVPLRRVQVNPVSMARALALIKSFCVQNGQSDAERSEIQVFVREDDILFVADWDQGHTRTDDGAERRFRYRHSVPLLQDDVSSAEWVGMVIRPQDLQEAFRNRVENSDQFGVLSDDEGIWMEVFASEPVDEQDSYPSRVVIHPDSSGRLETREVRSLRGASLDDVHAPEPVEAGDFIPDLDGDALFEAAGMANESVGLLLNPHCTIEETDSGNERVVDPAYVVGVGARGITLSLFQTPWADRAPTVEEQSDFFSAKSGQKPTGMGETAEELRKGRHLLRSVVLSPRFADTLGIAQVAFEEVKRVNQRNLTADWELKTLAAALATSLDMAGPSLLREVRETLGEKAAQKARGAATSTGGEEGAVGYATALLQAVDAERHADVARALELALEMDAPDPDSIASLSDMTGRDAAHARVAHCVLTAPDRTLLDKAAADAVGAAMISSELPRTIAAADLDSDHVTVNNGDYGLAAMKLAGSRFKDLAKTALRDLDDSSLPSWWRRFKGRLDTLEIPSKVVDTLVPSTDFDALSAPTPKSLRVPSKVRQAWLKDARDSVKGRIWSDPDGRVHAGFGDEDAGWVTFTDIAVRPNPEQFPLSEHEVRRLFSASSPRKDGIPLQLRASVSSESLQTVVNRVVGLPSDSEVDHPVGALMVARWTPPGMDPSGGLTTDLPGLADPNRLETPHTVYVPGEDGGVRKFTVESSGSDHDPDVQGTLRIIGFDRTGEHIWFDVPMEKSPVVRVAEPDKATAFALDSDHLHDAIDFATRRGRTSIFGVMDGVVEVHDPQVKRMMFLPTVTRTEVPERFEKVLLATGVPAESRAPLSLRDIVAQARELRASRVDVPEASPPSGLPSIRWQRHPAPKPGIRVPAPVYQEARMDLHAVIRGKRNSIRRNKELRALDDKALSRGIQTDMFSDREKSVSVSHIRGRLTREINREEQELRDLELRLQGKLDIDQSQPEIDVSRPGQGRQRIVNREHLEEFEEEERLASSDAPEPETQGDVPAPAPRRR